MKNPLIEPLEARIAPAGVFSIVKQGDVVEGNTGERDLIYIVKLTGEITSEATVHVKTEDVGAVAGSDYTAIVDEILTFQPGDTQALVTVHVKGDTLYEFDEIVRARISQPNGATLDTFAKQFANATIINDDPVSIPVVSVDDVTIVEGDTGETTATFHVQLSNVSESTVTVNVSVAGNTATAGADFVTKATTTLTFLKGETSKDFSVQVIGDLIREATEIFRVTLSSPTNATLGDAEGTGTITDNNDPVPTITLDAASLAISTAEGNTGVRNAVFTAKLSNASFEAITVTAAPSSGTATAGSDFNGAPVSITFNAGETTKTFSVPIIGDVIDELDETFFVDLTNPSASGTLGAVTHAVGTILNDEILISVSDPAPVLEANGDTTLTFNLTLSKASNHEVRVNFATQNGTAIAGATNDFEALASTTHTFNPGETTFPVSVVIKGDTVGELAENFFLKLTSPFGAVLARDTATGTILNDDTALTIGDVQILEGGLNGVTQAVFTVTLSNGPVTENVTVQVDTADGTDATTRATAGTDYTAEAKTLLFVPGGETTKQVIVSIRGDGTPEQNEFFAVNLSNATNATIARGTGTGTILNDDNAFTINDVTVTEGDSGTLNASFLVRLLVPSGGSPPSQTVTVDVSTEAGTASSSDFTAVTRTLSFASGVTQQIVTVPIVGDLLREGMETFLVKLANPSVGVTIAKSAGIGTILDNGDPAVTVSVGDVSIAEGNGGTTTYSFQVSVNPQESAILPNTVTVNFATADGTAVSTGAKKDFTAQNGTLTFVPGGDLTQTVSIVVEGDARLENSEQFFLNLLSATGAGIADNQGTATITNDDAVRISIGDAALTEGNTSTSNMNFAVTLDGTSDVPVTVVVNTVDGTAVAASDFTKITNRTITFAPGENSKTVSVAIVGDTTEETISKAFTVKLSAPTPAGATLLDDTGTGTITDNDLPTLSVSDATVIEGDSGQNELAFTVSLSSVAKEAVTFTYSTADITAAAGQDYDGITQGTATIAKDASSVVVKIKVNGDATPEVNERLLLNLLSSASAKISTSAGRATGTIVDDEPGGARLELVAVAVNGDAFAEADRFVEFRVERTGDTTRAVSVQYETEDFTARSFGSVADFVSKSGTISFAAGSTTASELIRVRIIGDINFEDDETFGIRLFNPINAAILDDDVASDESSTVVTINDDGDLAPTLSILDARIVEGTGNTPRKMEFIVELTAANEKNEVKVFWETLAGLDLATAANPVTGLTAVQDYVPTTGKQPLTFLKGETEQKILVTINGDARDETFAETFRVQLSGESGAAVTRADAVGTIEDDDAAPTLTFSGPATSPVEGDVGVTTATYTVTLSAFSELPVSVQVTTNGITAVSSGLQPDFEARNHFPVAYVLGISSKTIEFTVLINSDLTDEGDETYGVTISDAVNATIGGATSVTTTIVDNDPLPVIVVSDANVIEGNSGTQEMVFTVSLSAASEKTVEVKYATQDVTTLTGATSVGPMADFLAKSGTLTFTPGQTQKEVRVVINGDTFKEQIETFSLQISGEKNGTILPSQATGTGTILTDGDTTIGIAIRDAFSVEGVSGVTAVSFTVELSDALTTATTFAAVGTNGTAVRGQVRLDNQNQPAAVVGGDFALLGNAGGKFEAGTKTATVTAYAGGDSVFEATESFFVSLRNVVNAGGETLTIAGGAGRGTIFNDDLRRVDNQTIQFIDKDGDLATVHISKGFLDSSRLSFSEPSLVGGRQLEIINLLGNNSQFQNANLAVSAVTQPGFNGSATGVRGDGLVNVGWIIAANVNGNVLQFLNGIDLNNVRIDGDLGKIWIGDTVATSAVKNLVVRSMGRLGTTTQDPGTPDNRPNTFSLVLGPIDNLHVLGNFQSTLNVLGSKFGIIRNLQIDGALLGGDATNSGQISFTGRIDNAQIGRIVGGAGDSSGALVGATETNARIVNLHVTGAVRGGTGSGSGIVSSPAIGTARVGALAGGDGAVSGNLLAETMDLIVVSRNVIGGGGESSGRISAGVIGNARVFGEVRGDSGELSGSIVGTTRLSELFVFGSIFGGTGNFSGNIASGSFVRIAANQPLIFNGGGAIAVVQTGALVGGDGENSGAIRTGGNLLSLTVNGNIEGGSGNGSGGVEVSGKLTSALIGGDVAGGDSTSSTALVKSGFVTAHRLQNLTITGDLKSGKNGGVGIASSGTIRSETTIGSIRINGNVTGSEAVAAIIAAPGDTSGAAIRTLKIGGDATFAEILGGYGANATAALPRGNPTNADAQIGTVNIVGNTKSTSIIAGVAAGPDGLFGTTDDFPLGGTGVTNAARTVSKIASITIGGVVGGAIFHGIEAQHLQSIVVNKVAFSLQPGPGSTQDGAPGRELVAGSKVFVFEVPVV